ncbi:MAG: molecular chaperone DnaJ [Candidatus Acidoferrales bacterium]
MARSPNQRDYYQILGVDRRASTEEIKKAYRRAALEWHPDRNPLRHKEAEERFKELTQAYSVLADAQKRAAFDRYGHAGLGAQPFTGFDESIFAEFTDIFGDIFGFEDLFGLGGGRRRSRVRRGRDLRYDLDLTFEEAARGLTTKVKLPRLELCSECGGSGARKGTGLSTCNACHGRGQIHYQRGFLAVSRTCPQCQGSGQVIRDSCPACRGQGQVRRECTLEIRIPPGVDTGTRLRIAGEGEAGQQGGPSGDLFVVLRVEEHDFFERREADLYCSIPISFPQAVLGGEIRVPALEGEQTLKVPAGTQSGSLFRLRGKGFPTLNGGSRGDLFVELRVETPKKLTREQRQLIERLAETLPAENRPAAKASLLERFKDIFG